MPWSTTLAAYITAVTPLDVAQESVTGYVLGFGPLGLVTLALAYLLYKGWRLVPPDRDAAIRASARDEARADLIEERARVLAEKTRIEQERDEAQRFTQANLVPLLTNFTAATSALIPLLQELLRHREDSGSDNRRRR